jgi:predicted nucleic-acid-binding Zn-ribbon protein
MSENSIEEKAQKWISDHWHGSSECPVCGANDWLVSDKLLEIREYRKGNIDSAGEILPLIATTCGGCGYTVFLNAIVAGIINKKES